MYLELYGRDGGDRLGGNLVTIISQILYAINNNIYIKYNKDSLKNNENIELSTYNNKYNKSIFIETLFDFIDEYNKNIIYDSDKKIDLFTMDFFEMISKVLINIKIDHFTFFKKNVYPKIKNNFLEKAKNKRYTDNISFNPNETILVHLRLDDCKFNNDYDGRICSEHFNKKINNNIIVDMNTHNESKILCQDCNLQAPLSKNKIQEQIDIALKKHPNYEVIIITNPGEDTKQFPYRYIQNNDENLDLFLLCNSKIVILSRSTYSLSSLFFGIAEEVYVPVWGHTSCFGINNKYDKCNFNIFY